MKVDIEILRLLMRGGAFIELLTALIASIYINKYKNTALKYFILVLWYTVINEFVGIFYLRDNFDFNNAIIYNIYNILNFSYIYFLYAYYLNNKTNKKIALLFGILYILILIINGFFENYLIHFQRFPYIIAAFFVVIIIILYFREILNSEKVLHVKKNLFFWVSIGWLIYFVGNIPFRIVRNYYENLADASAIFLVNFTLTMIMNICFIIGFIWSEKKQHY